MEPEAEKKLSNEELAVQIQAGHPELMADLWEQTRRFIEIKARKIPLEGRGDVELDDLIQAGYLALMDAVADYKPGEYAFLTHLGYRLKTAFAEATRFRSLRQQRETLTGTLSLNAPATDEANASTLGDFQEDPTGAAALENAEERIYQAQLREAVAAVMADLPEGQRELLRLRYWEDLTLDEVGELQGVSAERVRKKENRAIRELRKPRNAVRLRQFCDFDFYNGIGLGAFRSTGASIQERYLMKQDRIRERQEAKKHQEAIVEEMQRIEEKALHRAAMMTPEEKRALLEKYGYA